MSNDGYFKSPLCGHTISSAEFDYNDWVTCVCGARYNSLTVRAFVLQKEATDKAYFAFEAQRKLYDRLFETLKAELDGRKATGAAAAPAAKPVQAAATIVAADGTVINKPGTTVVAREVEPVFVEPPAPKLRRPKRAPFSPRTLMFLVAGLLAVVGVSSYAVTVHDVVIGTTVVAIFDAALGYGGYRAHKVIRGLGNFLTALASTIFGVGLFALANLYIPWKEAGLADAYHSPYMLLSALITALASLVLGWRFKIAGWFSIGPIGLGVAMMIATFAYIPGSLMAAGVSTMDAYGWSILGTSVFTLAIGATAPMLRLEIPEFEDPTDEEQFLVHDMTRERTFARQSLLMAMIVSAGLLTVRYAQVVFGILAPFHQFNNLPVAALATTGAVWLAGGAVIDRIGHRFTSSGQPNRILQRGAWILGFVNLAIVGGKLAGQMGGYAGAAVASVLALVFLLLPRYVGVVRTSEDTSFATTVAGWTTWAIWWFAIPGMLVDSASGVWILTVQLALMAFSWQIVRLAYRSGAYQDTSLILGGLSAVIIPIAAASGNSLGTDGWLAAAIMVAASAAVVALSWVNRFVNKRVSAQASRSANLIRTSSLYAAMISSLMVAAQTSRAANGSLNLHVLSIQFATMAVIWLAVRLLYSTAAHQLSIIVLAGLCSVFIPVASPTGSGMGADMWLVSGLLFLAAAVVTVITLANQLINRRLGSNAAVNLPMVGTLSHSAVAISSIVSAAGLAKNWTHADAYLALPLVGAALVISVLRFISTAKMADDNPLFSSVKIGTAPYLLLALVAPILSSGAGSANLPEMYSITLLAITLVVVGFATLRRVKEYGFAGILLTLALSVVVDYTVHHLVNGGKFELPFAVGLAVFVASFAGIYVSYAKRLPDTASVLARSTALIYGIFAAVHAGMVNTGPRPGDSLVWIDSLTLVAVGAFAVLFSRGKLFSAIDGFTFGAVTTGWLNLVFAEGAAFATAGNDGTLLRVLVVNALAVAVVLRARKRQLVSGMDLVISLATYAELILGAALVYRLVSSDFGFGPVVPFVAIAGAYLVGFGLRRFAAINHGWTFDFGALIGVIILTSATLGESLTRIDGARTAIGGALTDTDWAPVTLALTVVGAAALLWRHIRKADGLKYFAEVLVAWAYGFWLTLPHHTNDVYAIAGWVGLLAVLIYAESFLAKRQVTALIAFIPAVIAGWMATHKLLADNNVHLTSVSSLVPVVVFALSTALALRAEEKTFQAWWSLALPVSTGVGYAVGLVAGNGLNGVNPAGNTFDWIFALVVTVAYLRLSHSKLWSRLPNAQGSLRLSAGVNWVFGLPAAMALQAGGWPSQYATFVYALVSTLVLVWYGWTYASRFAIYGIYAGGAATSAAFQVAFGKAADAIWQGPEFVLTVLALTSTVGTFVLEAKTERFKGTMVRWGIPLGILLVPSAVWTISTSALKFDQQSGTDVARFIAVSVISIAGVLIGIRIGNRGITTATTTSLMVALVPGLWYRLADLTTSPAITNETRALLVAVTVYVLIYIFRKNTHVSLPSLVVWGIPVVISLSVTFIDAINATHGTLTAEDWIRFGILMGAGTLFLVLGATRRVAGMFYPGLLTVVISVIPYAWSNGGWMFAVLLALAGLIVWAAIRLDRFTGWLKALD